MTLVIPAFVGMTDERFLGMKKPLIEEGGGVSSVAAGAERKIGER